LSILSQSLAALILVCALILNAGCGSALPTNRVQPPTHVWLLGDSLTGGLYASDEDATFRSLLFGNLQEQSGHQIEELYWRRLCTLANLEGRWEEMAGHPDLVFIEIGINDVANANCEQVPESAWRARYGAMLDRIRERAPGVAIVVGTIPWCGWPEGDPAREQAIAYNGWIRAEADARGIAVADLWAATADRPDGLSAPDQASPFPPQYWGDWFHPNDVGHARIAETFYQTYVEHYANNVTGDAK